MIFTTAMRVILDVLEESGTPLPLVVLQASPEVEGCEPWMFDAAITELTRTKRISVVDGVVEATKE